jgi:hypothetical protein
MSDVINGTKIFARLAEIDEKYINEESVAK